MGEILGEGGQEVGRHPLIIPHMVPHDIMGDAGLGHHEVMSVRFPW